MDDSTWIQVGHAIDEMRERGFFMAVWSPGQVTDSIRMFNYPRWRVHFQRGAEQTAPTYDAEGYGEGETLLEAVQTARTAALDDLKAFEEANG